MTKQVINGVRERALVAAHVDVEERRRLFELARLEDRSVSAILRRAVRAELERSEEER